MRRAEIPTADFDVFTRPAAAKEWARAREGQVAVKADGLEGGKGVIVCGGVEESDKAIDAVLVEQRFGRSGATIVVEERLDGPELSVQAITDGTDVIALAPARDYKRAEVGDRGANTGGMGAYSPPKGVEDALLPHSRPGGDAIGRAHLPRRHAVRAGYRAGHRRRPRRDFRRAWRHCGPGSRDCPGRGPAGTIRRSFLPIGYCSGGC